MELHTLKPAEGSVKAEKKRVGRGQGSGKGGTSARGHKGAKSRSGYKSKRNHEGGQMPLQMRLPKRGFKSPNRVEYTALSLEKISNLIEKHGLSEISPEVLRELGTIKKRELIKVVSDGDLGKGVKITAHAFSGTAKTKIESAGGSIEQL
jgi:large subunit ribosomal protein L15